MDSGHAHTGSGGSRGEDPVRLAEPYRYLGDRLADSRWRNQWVWPVRRADGKTVRGRNGNLLVEDAAGRRAIVLGRRLRRAR